MNSCNNNRNYQGTLNQSFIGILVDDGRYSNPWTLPYPVKPGNVGSCSIYMDDYKRKPYKGQSNTPYLRDKYSYLSTWYWQRSGGDLPPGIKLTENSGPQGNFYGRKYGLPRNILDKNYSEGQVGTILEGKPTEVGTWVSTFNLMQEYVVDEPIRQYACAGTAAQVKQCMEYWKGQGATNEIQFATEVVGSITVTIDIVPNQLGTLFYPNSFFAYDRLSQVSEKLPLLQNDCVVTGINAVDFPPGLGVAFSTTSSSLIESVTITGSPTLTGFFASTLTPSNTGGNGTTSPIYFKIRDIANFSTSSGSFAQNPSPFVSIYDITGYVTGSSYSGFSGVKHDLLLNNTSLLGMTGRDPFFSLSANSLGDFFAVSSPCNYQSLKIKSANLNKLGTSQFSGFGRLKSFALRKNGTHPNTPLSGIKIGDDLLSDYNNAFLGSDLSLNPEGDFLVSSLYDNHGISAYVLKKSEKLVLSDPSTLCTSCGFLSSSTIDEDVPPPVGYGFGCSLYWNKKKSFSLSNVSFDYDPSDNDTIVDVASDEDMYLYADAIGEYVTTKQDSHWCVDWYQTTDEVTPGVGTGFVDGKCYIAGRQVSMILSYRKKSDTIQRRLPDGAGTKPVFYVSKIVTFGSPALVARLSNDINTEKENGRAAFLYSFNFHSLPFYKGFGGATFNFLKNVAAVSAKNNTLQRSTIQGDLFTFDADENATNQNILQNVRQVALEDSCVLCDVIKQLTNSSSSIPLADRTNRTVKSDYCVVSGGICCDVPENYFWGSDPLCSSQPASHQPIGQEISFIKNGVAEKSLLFMLSGVDEQNPNRAFDPRAVYYPLTVNGKTLVGSDGYRLLSSNLSNDSKGTKAAVASGDLSVGFLAGSGSF